ncbi:MAG: hypothetical protein IKR76_03890 [Ruminococcus sp.]|nr:hypothetical protein [Ruminococcus sp.]
MKRLIAVIMAAAMTLALVSCGDDDSSKKSKSKSSSSQASMKKFDEMAGEYECYDVITNFNGSDAGYRPSEAEERFKGSTIKLEGDKLEMEGREYDLKASKSENGYYTYMVVIKDNGYDEKPHNSDRKFCDEGFEGPVWFMYAKEGTDQGGETPLDKDTIEMYYSPKGTQDWYFALDFHRK